MMKNVTADEKNFIERIVRYGHGEKILPFYFMDWVVCTANTAHDWLGGMLDNVHTARDADWSQVEQITHTGAPVIGTGHTYQQKHQEIADIVLSLAKDWTA